MVVFFRPNELALLSLSTLQMFRKDYSSGNYRVSAGIPCKNHRETLGILQGNPVIFTYTANITGFPCKIPRVSL